jgi:hypothetical protein
VLQMPIRFQTCGDGNGIGIGEGISTGSVQFDNIL